MVTRRCHQMARAQNAHDLVHVILIRAENRHAAAHLGHQSLACIAVEHLHAHAHKEYGTLLAETRDGSCESRNISGVGSIDFTPGFVKINRAVMALFVRACYCSCSGLCQGRFHWPPKWIDRAGDKHWRVAVPSRIAQSFFTILRTARLKRPCRVRTMFRGD